MPFEWSLFCFNLYAMATFCFYRPTWLSGTFSVRPTSSHRLSPSFITLVSYPIGLLSRGRQSEGA